jgi:hypothetical protein
MRAVRGGLVLLAVGCVVLAGCTPTTKAPEPTTTAASSATPSAAATRKVDLQKLNGIKADFPPGFPVNGLSGVSTNDAQRAAGVGDFVSYGKSLSVEPAACRVLLNPVEARANADWIAVTSSQSAEGPFVAVEVDDPVVESAVVPVTGCDQFRFTVAGALPDGTAQRLAAPSFEDAISYAVKVDYDVTNPRATKPILVEYFYTAILDGRTLVNVWARVPTDFAAEPALPDLLTKAVHAIRGS